MHDVAVLHDVGLTFYPKVPSFLDCLLRPKFPEGLVGCNFRTNKSSLEVGVDLTCGNARLCTVRNSPRSHLIFTDREERYEIQEAIRRSNESRESRLIEPKVLKAQTQDYLRNLPWPGNVRQLENTCRWITVIYKASFPNW